MTRAATRAIPQAEVTRENLEIYKTADCVAVRSTPIATPSARRTIFIFPFLLSSSSLAWARSSLTTNICFCVATSSLTHSLPRIESRRPIL